MICRAMAMATDKTWFDEWLKGNLARDIAFRTAVWFSIAFVTLKHAADREDFNPADAFQSAIQTVAPVIVDVGAITLILCLVALLLKDLESVDRTNWGQDTAIGRWGGFIRRLAGDLSLWIVGALISVAATLAFLTFSVYGTKDWTLDNQAGLVGVGVIFTIGISVLSLLSVWVRQDISLVSSHAKLLQICNRPWKVVLFYVLLLSLTWVMHTSDRGS